MLWECLLKGNRLLIIITLDTYLPAAWNNITATSQPHTLTMPVSSVPSALLSKILVHHVWMGQQEGRYREWYGLLTVCRQWYHTALECPHLWDFIDLASPFNLEKNYVGTD